MEQFISRMADVGVRFNLSRASLAYQINDNLRSMKAKGLVEGYTISWPFNNTVVIDYEDADGLYALSWEFEYLYGMVSDLKHLDDAYDRAMKGI